MLEIRDGRYFSRFFFQDTPGANVMGALYRDEQRGNEWVVLFRVRNLRDDKIFDSEDERRWIEAPLGQKTEVEVLERFAAFVGSIELAAVTCGKGFCPVDVVVVDSDDAQVVMQKLADRPWAHHKLVNGAEA